jgi:hypothetical protein
MEVLLKLAEVAAESNTLVSEVKDNFKGAKRDKRAKEDALYQAFPKPFKYEKKLMRSHYMSKTHPTEGLVTLAQCNKECADVWETKLAPIWRRNKKPRVDLEDELKTLVESAAEADSAAEEVKKELKRQKREARSNEKAIRNKIPNPTEQEKRVVLIAYANEQARQGILFTEEMWQKKEADIWGSIHSI